jgi:hypothetical protein
MAAIAEWKAKIQALQTNNKSLSSLILLHVNPLLCAFLNFLQKLTTEDMRRKYGSNPYFKAVLENYTEIENIGVRDAMCRGDLTTSSLTSVVAIGPYVSHLTGALFVFLETAIQDSKRVRHFVYDKSDVCKAWMDFACDVRLTLRLVDDKGKCFPVGSSEIPDPAVFNDLHVISLQKMRLLMGLFDAVRAQLPAGIVDVPSGPYEPEEMDAFSGSGHHFIVQVEKADIPVMRCIAYVTEIPDKMRQMQAIIAEKNATIARLEAQIAEMTAETGGRFAARWKHHM